MKKHNLFDTQQYAPQYYEELMRIIEEKEIQANHVVSRFYTILVPCYMLFWGLLFVGLYKGDSTLRNVTIGANLLMTLLVLEYYKLKERKGKELKYCMMVVMALSLLGIVILSGYKLWIAMAIPIMISCRYYNRRFTVFNGLFSCVCIVAGAFTNAYISPKFGYLDLNTVSFPQEIILTIQDFLYEPSIRAGLDPKTILINTLWLSTFGNVLVMVLLTIVCLFVVVSTQNVIYETIVMSAKQARMEVDLADNQAKTMLSQIQPHFLYNTLSAIMAIEDNPDETVEALGEFAKYLRENLDVITSGKLISFNQELIHVRRYVALENLRFDNRIQVEYDTESESFRVPPLTVQILVENAIKHGIFNCPSGGTVRVSTKEEQQAYVITVEDNGVGFFPETVPEDGKHIGLSNLKTRLAALCDGELSIESEIGKGTKVIVQIPKLVRNVGNDPFGKKQENV